MYKTVLKEPSKEHGLVGVEEVLLPSLVVQGGASWPAIKANVAGLVEKAAAWDVAAATTEQGEAAKAGIDGVDAAAVPFTHIAATSGSAGAAAEWVAAAAAHIEAYAAFKAKEAEAAEAAAAAAAEAGAE